MKFHISFLFRITFSLIISSLLTINILSFAGKKLEDDILLLAKSRTNEVALHVALNSVSDNVLSTRKVSYFFEKEDIVFEPNDLSFVLKESVDVVYQELKKVEFGTSKYVNYVDHGIIGEIPFSLMFDNFLLSNIGPKLPLKFTLIGDVSGEIDHKISEFGINNALVELKLLLKINTRINIPLKSEISSSSLSIPLFSKIYEGEIPSLFYENISQVNKLYSSETQL